MPRQLQIEYPGAIYHVLNRGIRREPIFRDARTRCKTVVAALCERRGDDELTSGHRPPLQSSNYFAPDGVGEIIGRGCYNYFSPTGFFRARFPQRQRRGIVVETQTQTKFQPRQRAANG